MLMAIDTVIFLLQQLGFVLNLMKSVLTPTQTVPQSSADTDRCIQNEMGCSMSRINREAMVKGETVVTHKCVRTESSTISTFDLQQTKIFEGSSFLNRQYHCTTVPYENGWNREPNVTDIKQRNLAVSLETPDHNYCRIPSKFFECGGRLVVSKQQGSIRMKTLPKVFQQIRQRGDA